MADGQNGAGSGVLETSAGFVILMFNIVLIRVGGETAVAVFSIISNIGYVGKGIFNGMAQAASRSSRSATARAGTGG